MATILLNRDDNYTLERMVKLESELKHRDKQYIELKKDYQTVNSTVHTLQRQIELLSSEKDMYRQNAEHNLQERKQAQHAIKSLTKEISHIRAELRDKEVILRQREKGLKDITNKMEKESKQSYTYLSTVYSSNHKDQISLIQKQQETLQKRVLTLQKENELLTARGNRMEKKLQETSKILDEKDENIMLEQKRFRQEKINLNREIEHLKKENRLELDLRKREARTPIPKPDDKFTESFRERSKTDSAPLKSPKPFKETKEETKKFFTPILEKSPVSHLPIARSPPPISDIKEKEKESKIPMPIRNRALTEIPPDTCITPSTTTSTSTQIKPFAKYHLGKNIHVITSRTNSQSMGSTLDSKSKQKEPIQPRSPRTFANQQMTRAKQELTQKFQKELMEKDKIIKKLKNQIQHADKQKNLMTENQKMKSKIENFELQLNQKDILYEKSQGQINEIDLSLQKLQGEHKKIQIQNKHYEDKLSQCPNPEKVQEMNAQIMDLQNQVIEYQHKYEMSLKRRRLPGKGTNQTEDENKKLSKKVEDLEFVIHYGDTQKDKEISRLKKVINDETTRREKEKTRETEKELKLRTQLKKYQMIAVEQWIFQDGDLSVY